MGHDPLSIDIERELLKLRRGGGVYAPRLKNRIGPLLQELLSHSDGDVADAPAELAELLDSASAMLPPGRRALVPLAYATRVELGGTTLSQRLEHAGRQMERDMRTVQRRVSEVTDRLAVELAARLREARGRGAFVQSGWSVERFDATLNFQGSRPILSEARQIRVRSESLTQIQANISLLGSPPVDGDEPEIVAIDGCEVREISRLSDRFWTVTLQLPGRLEHGAVHFYSYDVRIPTRECLAPMYGFAPLRASRWFEASIIFADPDDVTGVWAFSGVPQTVLGQPMPNDVELSPSEGGIVTITHEYLVQGLCYGVRWGWR